MLGEIISASICGLQFPGVSCTSKGPQGFMLSYDLNVSIIFMGLIGHFIFSFPHFLVRDKKLLLYVYVALGKLGLSKALGKLGLHANNEKDDLPSTSL